MSEAPVSVSIYIGDIPEEDTDTLFTFLRKLGINFSFSVGDVYQDEEEHETGGNLISDEHPKGMTIKEMADAYEAEFPREAAIVDLYPESTTCPTCILPKGHDKECGPAWMPTDNR